MKEAIRATSVEPASMPVVEPVEPVEPPVEELDRAELAALVVAEQSTQPRAPRVAVASTAWNELASGAVSRGLRRLETAGRSRRLFEAAIEEPTHLTPLCMTAAASLALRTGDAAPWKTRAASLHHDPRALPGLDKAGVMIGVAFTGPARAVIDATGDPDWFELAGIELICHAHLYDALLIRVPSGTGGSTCYLIPVHVARGQSNRVLVEKLFGRPGTAPGAFARVRIDGARAMRVGPAGAGDRLFRPVIERLRADSAIVGAAQMRAAADALAGGLERGIGADVFHRQFVDQVEVGMAEAMALDASERLASDGVGGLSLVLAQHWIRSRFGNTVPDASALMQLTSAPMSPAVAWTSPLLPLWGGTASILRSDFMTWADRGALAPFLDRCDYRSGSNVLRRAHRWLIDVANDARVSPTERMEAAALTWAASLLTDRGDGEVLAVLLGSESGPKPRKSRLAEDRLHGADPTRAAGGRRTVDTGDEADLVIDLREHAVVEPAPTVES